LENIRSRENRDFQAFLIASELQPDRVMKLKHELKRGMVENSMVLTSLNFKQISISDLELMFDFYDRMFMNGMVAKELTRQKTPLRFRLSSRMTSKGGKVVCFMHRGNKTGFPRRSVSFELVISSALLFQTFCDPINRQIKVNGKTCCDRLDALQLIFEHELIHLAENLAFGNSSCNENRFRSIALRFFGHTETNHDLVSFPERAQAVFKIKCGDKVSFSFDSYELSGFVNRITKRATVLVENGDGATYSDGKKYLKYYVPLEHLKKKAP